jgi:hypothetical protein
VLAGASRNIRQLGPTKRNQGRQRLQAENPKQRLTRNFLSANTFFVGELRLQNDIIRNSTYVCRSVQTIVRILPVTDED